MSLFKQKVRPSHSFLYLFFFLYSCGVLSPATLYIHFMYNFWIHFTCWCTKCIWIFYYINIKNHKKTFQTKKTVFLPTSRHHCVHTIDINFSIGCHVHYIYHVWLDFLLTKILHENRCFLLYYNLSWSRYYTLLFIINDKLIVLFFFYNKYIKPTKTRKIYLSTHNIKVKKNILTIYKNRDKLFKEFVKSYI